MTGTTLRVCGFGVFGVLLFATQACAVGTEAREDLRGEETSVTLEPIIGGERTTSYPEAALLNMRSIAGGSYACSAVLVAPKVVLTAGHCVDGMASWDVYVDGVHGTSTRGETYDWRENGAATVNPDHHDVGLVYLDQAIVLAAYPTLASAPVANGAQVVDVGRIDNGTFTNAFYRATVAVSAGAAVGYGFDYYAKDVIEHGDSGGPVFLPSTHTIVAVNSGANTSLEVLARVDLVRAWISQRIAATGGPTDAGAPTDAGGRGDSEATVDAGQGRDGASAAKPDAGLEGEAGSASPDRGRSDSKSCTSEVEPNDSVARANALGDSQCGALRPGTDVDWAVLTARPGTTRITLVPAADAVLTVGYLTAQSTCSVVMPASGKYRGAIIVTAPAQARPVQVCVAVSSPGRIAQAYTLTATR